MHRHCRYAAGTSSAFLPILNVGSRKECVEKSRVEVSTCWRVDVMMEKSPTSECLWVVRNAVVEQVQTKKSRCELRFAGVAKSPDGNGNV